METKAIVHITSVFSWQFAVELSLHYLKFELEVAEGFRRWGASSEQRLQEGST